MTIFKNCNETILVILKPCTDKVFGREYINQIREVANAFHSYLIQVYHAILKDFLWSFFDQKLLKCKHLFKTIRNGIFLANGDQENRAKNNFLVFKSGWFKRVSPASLKICLSLRNELVCVNQKRDIIISNVS